MSGRHLLALSVLSLLFVGHASAQRYEAEIHFDQLKLSQNNLGVGGKFGFALNKNFTLEGVVNFFPQNNAYPAGSLNPVGVGILLPTPIGTTSTVRFISGTSSSGRLTEGLFGLKARIYGNDRFTLSAKVRPGFASFGNVVTPAIQQTTDPGFPFNVSDTLVALSSGRQTGFAFDYGGVLDFDTGRHTFLSLEFGDTALHLPVVRPIAFVTSAPLSISIPGKSTNNLQLSVGWGIRF